MSLASLAISSASHSPAWQPPVNTGPAPDQNIRENSLRLGGSELIPSFIAVFTIIWAHYLVMRHQKCKVHPHSLRLKNPIYVAPKQLYCSSPLTASIPSRTLLLCSLPRNNWEYSNFQQREQLWSGLGTLITSPLSLAHKFQCIEHH